MNITLIHYASPPVVGGVETVLARQAELFARAGHHVQILTGRGAPWDARINVCVLPEFDSRHPLVLSLKQQLDGGIVPPDFDGVVDSLLTRLREHLSGQDCLIVHNAASLHKNLALTAALHRFSESANGMRIILWHHDFAWTGRRYESELHPGYPWDLLRTHWPGVVQVTISDSRQTEMSRLFKLPAAQIHVVPNGVDMENFLALQPETRLLVDRLNLYEAAPLLLAPVRLTRRKNLEFGLRIMAELHQRLPQARWVVTGPLGAHNPENLTYYRSLVDLRRELGLENVVIFLAESFPDGLSDAQIADFYRIADALLITSQEEGFGLPLIEAGLARMAIFASDIPPLRALGGKWATYFSLQDAPADVAVKIAARLEGDAAYSLRAHIRAKFTWEAIYQHQIAPLLT
jgi:glycosyltransferase involved in cell wall biosynthesis